MLLTFLGSIVTLLEGRPPLVDVTALGVADEEWTRTAGGMPRLRRWELRLDPGACRIASRDLYKLVLPHMSELDFAVEVFGVPADGAARQSPGEVVLMRRRVRVHSHSKWRSAGLVGVPETAPVDCYSYVLPPVRQWRPLQRAVRRLRASSPEEPEPRWWVSRLRVRFPPQPTRDYASNLFQWVEDELRAKCPASAPAACLLDYRWWRASVPHNDFEVLACCA